MKLKNRENLYFDNHIYTQNSVKYIGGNSKNEIKTTKRGREKKKENKNKMKLTTMFCKNI